MGENAGLPPREHGQRLEGHSERRGREIDEGRECSGALILEWEMYSRDAAMELVGWVLEAGDATRCWVVEMEWAWMRNLDH